MAVVTGGDITSGGGGGKDAGAAGVDGPGIWTVGFGRGTWSISDNNTISVYV